MMCPVLPANICNVTLSATLAFNCCGRYLHATAVFAVGNSFQGRLFFQGYLPSSWKDDQVSCPPGSMKAAMIGFYSYCSSTIASTLPLVSTSAVGFPVGRSCHFVATPRPLPDGTCAAPHSFRTMDVACVWNLWRSLPPHRCEPLRLPPDCQLSGCSCHQPYLLRQRHRRRPELQWPRSLLEALWCGL